MKILLLSLLRLGDIILHRELAKALKRQHPDCEIHFLIQGEFESVQCLLPEVDAFHHVPRKEIQAILVERAQSSLVAFQKLEGLIAKLNGLNFDLVLNATHNNLSVRLMDLLQAKQKRGVALEMGKKSADENSWQTYLNENFSELQGSRFHYLEVLMRSLNLPVQLPEPGQNHSHKRILLQVLTSDVKKNWGLLKFQKLMKLLKVQFVDYEILALCSPSEKKQTLQYFAEEDIITPNLQEAAELLRHSRLLITGDTSIQHLAAQNGCAVVSLFLGSADVIKTSPWQAGAWILQGQAPCTPCSPSLACSQPSHVCADSISVAKVTELVSGVLMRTEKKISDSEIWKNHVLTENFATFPTKASEIYQLEQAVWNAYLNSTEIQLEEANHSIDQMIIIQTQHQRFQQAISQLKAQSLSVEQVEAAFPQWKDSFQRVKRNPKLEAGWLETEQLCRLRENALNQILQNKGAYHERESGKSIEARVIEA